MYNNLFGVLHAQFSQTKVNMLVTVYLWSHLGVTTLALVLGSVEGMNEIQRGKN